MLDCPRHAVIIPSARSHVLSLQIFLLLVVSRSVYAARVETYTFIPRNALTNKTVAIAMASEPTATCPQMVKSQALSGW